MATTMGIPEEFVTRMRDGAGRLALGAKAATQFGSTGNLALAAVFGALLFVHSLFSTPLPARAHLAPSPPPAPTVVAQTRTADDVAAQPYVRAEPVVHTVNVAPGAVIETALDYDVAFYWPETPQTVNEPAAIRAGPAARMELIRSARPGERLRINGKVEGAPGGPWYRLRLADGRDGYFAGQLSDLGAFRRKRAAEAQAARAAAASDAEEASAVDVVPAGAPLALPEPPPPAF